MSFASQSNEYGAYVSEPDDGNPYWWLGSLTLNKVEGSSTGGGISVVDHRVPAGYTPPMHLHHGQDEVFYILEGHFTVHSATSVWQAGPGSSVFLPRDVPHGFAVSDDAPGRTLLINAPAGFEALVRDLGEPATALTLPGPDVPMPDPETANATSQRYGIVPASPDQVPDQR